MFYSVYSFSPSIIYLDRSKQHTHTHTHTPAISGLYRPKSQSAQPYTAATLYLLLVELSFKLKAPPRRATAFSSVWLSRPQPMQQQRQLRPMNARLFADFAR